MEEEETQALVSTSPVPQGTESQLRSEKEIDEDHEKVDNCGSVTTKEGTLELKQEELVSGNASSLDAPSTVGTSVDAPLSQDVGDEASETETNVPMSCSETSENPSSIVAEEQDLAIVKIKEEKVDGDDEAREMDTEDRENAAVETEYTHNEHSEPSPANANVNTTESSKDNEDSFNNTNKSISEEPDGRLECAKTPSECSETGSEKLQNIRSARARERSVNLPAEGHIGTKPKFRNIRPGFTFEPGIKVEAMDYLNNWYAAKIVRVDWDAQEVQIHFEGWNARYDEWLDFHSERLRPVPRQSNRRDGFNDGQLRKYKPGEQVLARWTDCRFYPAKIISNNNGSYQVLFYDGIKKNVQAINIRDIPPSLQEKKAKESAYEKEWTRAHSRRKMERSQSFESDRPAAPKRRLSGNSSTPVQSKRVRHSSTSPRLKMTTPPLEAPRSHSSASSTSQGSSSEIYPVVDAPDRVCRERNMDRRRKNTTPKRIAKTASHVSDIFCKSAHSSYSDGNSFKNAFGQSMENVEQIPDSGNGTRMDSADSHLPNSFREQVNKAYEGRSNESPDIIEINPRTDESRRSYFHSTDYDNDNSDVNERTLSAVHILGANLASIEQRQHLMQSQLVKLDTVNKRLCRVEQNQQMMFTQVQEMLKKVNTLVAKCNPSAISKSNHIQRKQLASQLQQEVVTPDADNASLWDHSSHIKRTQIDQVSQLHHEVQSCDVNDSATIWDYTSQQSRTKKATTSFSDHIENDLVSQLPQEVSSSDADDNATIWDITSQRSHFKTVFPGEEHPHSGPADSDIVTLSEQSLMTQYPPEKLSHGNNKNLPDETRSLEESQSHSNVLYSNDEVHSSPVPMYIQKARNSERSDTAQEGSSHIVQFQNVLESQDDMNRPHTSRTELETKVCSSPQKSDMESINNQHKMSVHNNKLVQIYNQNKKVPAPNVIAKCSAVQKMKQIRKKLTLMQDHQSKLALKRIEDKMAQPGDKIVIGSEDGAGFKVHRAVYLSCYDLSKTRSKPGQAFILKMMGKLFTKEELSNSSYIGGARRFSDGSVKIKETLDPVRLQAILAEAEALFGDVYNNMSDIRESINGKCRHTET